MNGKPTLEDLQKRVEELEGYIEELERVAAQLLYRVQKLDKGKTDYKDAVFAGTAAISIRKHKASFRGLGKLE